MEIKEQMKLWWGGEVLPTDAKIPYTDLKPNINKFLRDKWQKSWDDQIHKLYYVKNTIVEWLAGYRRDRKEVIRS